MKYLALSPDNIPIWPIAYTNRRQARTALREWAERYRRQGYYSTANRERIPVDDLLEACAITEIK